MKLYPTNHICTGKTKNVKKIFIKYLYPSIPQEVFDTLPPDIKLCESTYLQCTKIKTKDHAEKQDESCHNDIEPTNEIKHTDVYDTELMCGKKKINDDSIDKSIKATSNSRQDVLNHDLFETTSISTQNIQEIFQKNCWRKSYTDIEERSIIKRMNQICTLILAAAVDVHDFNVKDKVFRDDMDIAIACVVIMNDVKFKLEQYFEINLEDLNVEDHSNAIIETNDDDIEFEASNSITPTNTVQLNTVTSCATILKKILTKNNIMRYVKK